MLVPKDAVNSLEEAKTEPSPWIADEDGIAVLSEEDASCYQIIEQ